MQQTRRRRRRSPPKALNRGLLEAALPFDHTFVYDPAQEALSPMFVSGAEASTLIPKTHVSRILTRISNKNWPELLFPQWGKSRKPEF